jgi:hypothetical protein
MAFDISGYNYDNSSKDPKKRTWTREQLEEQFGALGRRREVDARELAKLRARADERAEELAQTEARIAAIRAALGES